MKKCVVFLTIGILLFSGALFAQTTQGASTSGSRNQSDESDYFAGGGYDGPILGIIAIQDLLNTAPNEFVKVEGYLLQQRVPGTYILGDAAQNPVYTVVIRLDPYFWANLDIDPDTPVIVYGVVNRSEMRIEIEGTRIDIQKGM